LEWGLPQSFSGAVAAVTGFGFLPKLGLLCSVGDTALMWQLADLFRDPALAASRGGAAAGPKSVKVGSRKLSMSLFGDGGTQLQQFNETSGGDQDVRLCAKNQFKPPTWVPQTQGNADELSMSMESLDPPAPAPRVLGHAVLSAPAISPAIVFPAVVSHYREAFILLCFVCNTDLTVGQAGTRLGRNLPAPISSHHPRMPEWNCFPWFVQVFDRYNLVFIFCGSLEAIRAGGKMWGGTPLQPFSVLPSAPCFFFFRKQDC
jgi:hypothetical protein